MVGRRPYRDDQSVAMSALLSPSARSPRTSTCRAVSPAGFSRVRRRAPGTLTPATRRQRRGLCASGAAPRASRPRPPPAARSPRAHPEPRRPHRGTREPTTPAGPRASGRPPRGCAGCPATPSGPRSPQLGSARGPARPGWRGRHGARPRRARGLRRCESGRHRRAAGLLADRGGGGAHALQLLQGLGQRHVSRWSPDPLGGAEPGPVSRMSAGQRTVADAVTPSGG